MSCQSAPGYNATPVISASFCVPQLCCIRISPHFFVIQ
ncbi:unnamed protein product, partial [Staurois parvus]